MFRFFKLDFFLSVIFSGKKNNSPPTGRGNDRSLVLAADQPGLVRLTQVCPTAESLWAELLPQFATIKKIIIRFQFFANYKFYCNHVNRYCKRKPLELKVAIVYHCFGHLNTPKQGKVGGEISSVPKAGLQKSGFVRKGNDSQTHSDSNQ